MEQKNWGKYIFVGSVNHFKYDSVNGRCLLFLMLRSGNFDVTGDA